jgi:Surface antigen variable number repeat/Omp85 superfamily domain
MIWRVFLVLALLLLASPARAEEVALPARIEEVRVLGLVRTHEYVVRRELGFHEGDVVTRDALDLAVTRLWNTTIFAQVTGEVVREGGRNVAVFTLEDRWTLNPLFRFQSGGSTFFFRLGAADNNIAGRLLEVQAQYEYFDGFHGGQALFRNPRLFDQRDELLVQVDRLTRPRPGFSDQRTQGIVELARLAARDRLRFGLRGSVFANRFLAPLEGTPYYPEETITGLVEPSFRLGRLDTVRLRQRGATFELRPGLGFTSSEVATQYVSMQAEALAFLMMGSRWNLAARVRGADVSRVPAHLQLFAGGLDLVRGFPDNYVRTEALALANVEVRFVLFDSTWIALMPVAFTDALAARSPSGTPGTALSAGAGLRVLVPKFVGTGLRVDFAMPIHAGLRGVTEAEQGRFGPATPRAEVGSVQPSFGVYQFF